MIEELAKWATPSLGGLCATFVLLIMTGRLVPVSTVRRLLDQERRRADDFKAAADAQGTRADKLVEQQDELLTLGRTAVQSLEALREASRRAGERRTR